MRAFVLGGGSNLGPMQAGALRALYENRIYPDSLVGCSVGSLNAAVIAQGFYEENLDKVTKLWGKIRRKDIYPGNKFEKMARLLLGQAGLSCNKKYRSWLVANGVASDKHFSQMPIPLYITATNCDTNRLHTFGKQDGDNVLDAIMASTAVPPLHAPWQIGDQHYVDGGTITPLPLRVALELGASEIYAIRVEHYQPRRGDDNFKSGTVGVVQRSINTMIHTQAEHDLHLARTAKSVKLHYITLRGPKSLQRYDFDHGEKLVERGYQLTNAYLHNHSPQVDEMQYTTSKTQQSISSTLQHFQSKLHRTASGTVQTA